MSARKRRFSASARVQLAMTGVLAVTIALLVLVAYGVTTRALVTSTDATLSREADAFQAAVSGAPGELSLEAATRAYLTQRTGSQAGLDPVLLAAFTDGRVISNSDLRLEDAPENTAAKNPPASPTFSTIVVDDVTYRLLSVPITSQGQAVGVFQVALSQAPATSTATRVAVALSAAGLLALALGVPLSYWATRRALVPLTTMAADAEEVTLHDPGRRIEYEGPRDELGSLADSLNAMLSRLERAYDDQRRFVADASHELRTPVAVVRGNVELLRAGALDADGADESLAMIETEAVRMSRLLDELLALARLESGTKRQFQPLELRTLVDEVAARGRALGEREFAVLGECGLWIEGDPDLLDQAFVNIVKNAIAHTAQGGTITLACSAEDGRARVTITDDGPGIPEADVERVFDRFYRAQGGRRDANGGGAGLGLAIAQRLIQLHGGEITAGNVSPHGARFTIELPRLQQPDETA